MKKTLLVTSFLLAISGSAFATTLTTNTASSAGAALYGGSTSAIALAATNAIVKLSTGVVGVINYNTANPTTYAIATKHDKGSKIFGTANDSTTLYWVASPAGTLTGTAVGSASDNANFAAGSTIVWTTY